MGACPSTPVSTTPVTPPPPPTVPTPPTPVTPPTVPAPTVPTPPTPVTPPPPPTVPTPPTPVTPPPVPAPIPTVPSAVMGIPPIQIDRVALELKNAGINRSQRADMLEALGYSSADIPRYNRLGAPPVLRQSYQEIGTQLRTLGFDPAIIRTAIETLGATPVETAALVLGGKRHRTTRRRKILRGGEPVKYEPRTRSSTEQEVQKAIEKSPGVKATIKKLIEQHMKSTS